MTSSDQVIVFGGAGFIGTHLLCRLVSSNNYRRIVSVDIGPPRAHVSGVEYLNLDVREPIDPILAQGSPAKIFNLAAIHVTPGHPEGDYYNTNVLGAAHVCRFASDTGSSSIVFTSSISVYGPSEAALDENSQPAPVSAYGRSKFAAEQIHRLWQSEGSGRKLTIVRPAVIYGRYERGNFTRLSRLLKRGTFIYPGRTDTIKSCGYVKDLVSSMLFMADRTNDQAIYNFCYPQRYTIEDICGTFSRVACYRKAGRVMPIWLMNLAVLPFEALQRIGITTGINRERVRKLWFSTNILPSRLVAEGFPFGYELESSLADWKADSRSSDFE